MNKSSTTRYLVQWFCIILSCYLYGCSSTSEKASSNTASVVNPEQTSSQAQQAWANASNGNYVLAQQQLLKLRSGQDSGNTQAADLAYMAWTEVILEQAASQQLAAAQQNALDLTVAIALSQRRSLHQNLRYLPAQQQFQFWQLQSSLYSQELQWLAAAESRVKAAKAWQGNAALDVAMLNSSDNSDYLKNHAEIWQALNQAEKITLEQALLQPTLDPETAAWIRLNLYSMHSLAGLDRQIQQIDSWQSRYPNHAARVYPPSDIALIRQAANQRPKQIAVILPLDGKYAAVGQAIRDGIMANFYGNPYKPSISFYSANPNDNFLSIYQSVVDQGADWIIGPLLKEQVNALYQFDKLPVPTLALNKTDTAGIPPLGLIEFSLSKQDDIRAIVKLMKKHHVKRVITLAEQASWSEQNTAYFRQLGAQQQMQVLGSYFFENQTDQADTVKQALNIDQSNKRIQKVKWLLGSDIETEARRRQDIDGILMLSKPSASASIRPLLAFYYASNVGMYATSSIYRGYPDKTIDNDLRGIIFTDMPIAIGDNQAIPENYQQSPLLRMFGFGQDALSIAERYVILSEQKNGQIQGYTGVLHLKDMHIERDMEYAYFRSGFVQALNSDLGRTFEKKFITPP
ncbi:MAG: penicillin-binding protein activator [Pseudomonadales bacterium]|nr:penicillin-binding protein activator [Pseudomonadales bacterium]